MSIAASALFSLLLGVPARAAQEHLNVHPDMRPGVLGEPRSRESSGTAWLPDASPMHALHGTAGTWELMLHGVLYVHWLDDGGDRGREQFGSTNWVMGMARHTVLGGEATVRAMLSADPLTADECGYPDLLATGELCDDDRLHDRQHPHDVFMELAGVYERALSKDVALQLYGGPVGEPALGPVAFPHRISSFPNAIAPIGHHWLDSTHIAFGVATAGLYGRRWKAEASLFNGREPDAERYDLDLDALDSYAGRIWVLPTDRWALQLSAGRLEEVESHGNVGTRIDMTRLTLSASYQRPLGAGGGWANTLAWGRNREGQTATSAFLAESAVNLAERDVLYGRIEVVEKTGDDLVLPEEFEDEIFAVAKLGLGYVRQLGSVGGLAPGIGGGITVSRVPDDLEPFYGSRTTTGLQVYFRLRPVPMHMTAGSAEEEPAPEHPH